MRVVVRMRAPSASRIIDGAMVPVDSVPTGSASRVGEDAGQQLPRKRLPRRVPVARRNLLAEKTRLLMSVGGVAFAVLLILLVASLYRGWSAAGGLFEELPGDIWLAQSGTSDPLRTSSFLPAEAIDEVSAVPGVGTAVPVYARRVAVRPDGKEFSVYFLALAAAAPEAWPPEARRFLPSPGSISVDAVFARDAGLDVGDTLDVLGRPLVVERIEPGGNPLFEIAFMNGDDARELIGLEGYVSYFLMVAEPDSDAAEVGRAAVSAFPGSEAHTTADFADATRARFRARRRPRHLAAQSARRDTRVAPSSTRG